VLDRTGLRVCEPLHIPNPNFSINTRHLIDDERQADESSYLPRLAGSEVLVQAIRDGVKLLTWPSDTFAYAESYDDSGSRYRGLRGGQAVTLSAESTGLLVKPDLARRQMDAETSAASPGSTPGSETSTKGATGVSGSTQSGATAPPGAAAAPLPRRFHGTVQLDPTRVGRDASRIADEVGRTPCGAYGFDRHGHSGD
jgi:hypothetical protein